MWFFCFFRCGIRCKVRLFEHRFSPAQCIPAFENPRICRRSNRRRSRTASRLRLFQKTDIGQARIQWDIHHPHISFLSISSLLSRTLVQLTLYKKTPPKGEFVVECIWFVVDCSFTSDSRWFWQKRRHPRRWNYTFLHTCLWWRSPSEYRCRRAFHQSSDLPCTDCLS